MRKVGIFSLILLVFTVASGASAPKMRSFVFDYNLIIDNVGPNVKEIKIWVPYPIETVYQIIEDLQIDTDWPHYVTYEKKYNNKVLYFSIKSPESGSVKINLQYKGKRYEYLSDSGGLCARKIDFSDSELVKYLAPSKLVTISPRIKSTASKITKDQNTTIEKAKAIYDYVIANVDYDKTVPGWGRGDTERVCDIRKGNCTDFHSLFISLARASKIPARFVIGFPLPKESEGRVKGYHCWAEFYAKGVGWIPVDASEAWKDRSRYEYLFGTLDENRIEFTRGRDIVLEPPQNGGALNYFIYPYVEEDGKVSKDINVFFQVKKGDDTIKVK